MSHCNASVSPYPTAGPFTAAMTTFRSERGSTQDGFTLGGRSLPGAGRDREAGSLTSAPAQNARPAPVSTMTRTASSASARRSASVVARTMLSVRAFSRCGRSSVTVATPSLTSYHTDPLSSPASVAGVSSSSLSPGVIEILTVLTDGRRRRDRIGRAARYPPGQSGQPPDTAHRVPDWAEQAAVFEMLVGDEVLGPEHTSAAQADRLQPRHRRGLVCGAQYRLQAGFELCLTGGPSAHAAVTVGGQGRRAAECLDQPGPFLVGADCNRQPAGAGREDAVRGIARQPALFLLHVLAAGLLRCQQV